MNLKKDHLRNIPVKFAKIHLIGSEEKYITGKVY